MQLSRVEKTVLRTVVSVYGTEAKNSEVEEVARSHGLTGSQFLDVQIAYGELASMLDAWLDKELDGR